MRNHSIQCAIVVAVSCAMLGCTREAKKNRFLEKAGKYYSAGQFEQAKVEYMNVLQLDPQNAIATERMGLIWYEQGSGFKALPVLLQIRNQQPGNYAVRTKLALAMIQAGRVTEARSEALSVVRESPTPNEAFAVLAETIRTSADLETTNEAIRNSSAAQSAWGLATTTKLLFLKGDVAAATEVLRRAVEQYPKEPVVHAAQAEAYFRQGDQAKARAELMQAAELSPPRSLARMRFAEYQVQAGARAEAITYLKDLIRQAPDYLPPKRLLAQIAINEKKYDEAEGYLKDIFTTDSGNIEARLVEAQLRVAKGELRKAIEGLEALTKAFRGFGTVYHNLARLHLVEGHPERATAVLQEGLTTHPDHADSLIMLAELNLRAGKGETVVGDMVNLLRQQPSLMPAQNLLIAGLRSMNKLDDAIKIVREQIRVLPKSPEPQVLLGTILLQQNNGADARLAFEKALELSPAHLPGIAALVDLDTREKKYDAAMRRVQEQKAKFPAAAELPYLEATVYIGQAQWQNAETALQKAIELNPNFSAAYDLLLRTYTASNNLPKAIQQLEETLGRQPNNQRARLMTGILYGQMNEFEKARTAYEKILADTPDSVLALNNLAYLYAENLGQLDRAVELANKARAADPASPMIADTLGWILIKRKEYPRALELITEAAAKMPDNPEMQYHLGVANQMVGQNEAARAAFTRAAGAPAEFKGKSEIKARLAALDQATPPPPPGAGAPKASK